MHAFGEKHDLMESEGIKSKRAIPETDQAHKLNNEQRERLGPRASKYWRLTSEVRNCVKLLHLEHHLLISSCANTCVERVPQDGCPAWGHLLHKQTKAKPFKTPFNDFYGVMKSSRCFNSHLPPITLSLPSWKGSAWLSSIWKGLYFMLVHWGVYKSLSKVTLENFTVCWGSRTYSK